MAQNKEWRELFPAIPNNKDGGQATLTVSTRGESGVITSTARLVFIKTEKTDSGRTVECKQFMMFQDYLERFKSVRMRATQKNIDTLHATALTELDTIRAAVRAHYNIGESQEVEEKQTRTA